MSTRKKHRGKNKKRNKSLKIQDDNVLPLPDKDKNLFCGQVIKNLGNGRYLVQMKSGEYQVQERTGKKNLRAKVDDYVLVENYLGKYFLHYIYKSGDKRQEIFKTDIVDYLKEGDIQNDQQIDNNDNKGGYVIDVNAI